MPLTKCPLKEFLIDSELNGFFFFGGGGGSVTFGLRIFHRGGEVK